jgi:hypothetical protein
MMKLTRIRAVAALVVLAAAGSTIVAVPASAASAPTARTRCEGHLRTVTCDVYHQNFQQVYNTVWTQGAEVVASGTESVTFSCAREGMLIGATAHVYGLDWNGQLREARSSDYAECGCETFPL